MASSKDKAIALKDNYVAGLIEAGATAPMPTMPEQNLGEIASRNLNVDTGKRTYINDGIPEDTTFSPSMGIKRVDVDPMYAMPIDREDIHDQHKRFGIFKPKNENVYTTVTEPNRGTYRDANNLGIDQGLIDYERKMLDPRHLPKGLHHQLSRLTGSDMRRMDPEMNPGMKRVRVKGQRY